MQIICTRFRNIPVPAAKKMMFCDFRGHHFIEHTLAGVEFVGCLFSGTSFANTNLEGTKFIACFAPPGHDITDFGACDLSQALFVDCCIAANLTQPSQNLCNWSTALTSTASGIISSSNVTRYQAVKALAELRQSIVAPALCCLLADEEWEIRSVCLQTLETLRTVDGVFPYEDEEIMKLMLSRLGDRSPFVRATASQLIGALQPSEEILHTIIFQRLSSEVFANCVEGFQIAAQLIKTHPKFRQLISSDQIRTLLNDEEVNSRIEALQFLAKYDQKDFLNDIIKMFKDPIEQVRIEAMRTASWLSKPPDKIHLLTVMRQDVSEAVRIEAIHVLGELGYFKTPDLLELLSLELSPAVRKAVQSLLGKKGENATGSFD
jgi:hypothetical protein